MDNYVRFCFQIFAVALVGVSSIHGRIAAQCSKNQGFCLPHETPCPRGFIKNPQYSGFFGCRRPDKKCCMFDASTSADKGEMSRDKCGIGSLLNPPRILNGFPTGNCDWPFVVSIRSLKKDATSLTYANSMHLCAGVLIDKQWVLTTPFCVLSAGKTLPQVPSNVLVVAGEYNVSKIDNDPVTGQRQEQWINVEKAYVKSNYEWTSFFEMARSLADTKKVNSNAVALLKLKEPIIGLCSGVACLPTSLEKGNDCASNDRCVVLGWGFTESGVAKKRLTVLNRGPIRLTSRKACDYLEKKMKLEKFRPAGTICQIQESVNYDSCLGDEGGPILCASGNNWVVRGLLPFNFCNKSNFNMWASDVGLNLEWILNTMKSN